VFVLERLFLPSLMIGDKAREPFGAPLYGWLLAFPTKITLGWPDMIKHSSRLGPFVSYEEHKVL
jgi:hypothetical protein